MIKFLLNLKKFLIRVDHNEIRIFWKPRRNVLVHLHFDGADNDCFSLCLHSSRPRPFMTTSPMAPMANASHIPWPSCSLIRQETRLQVFKLPNESLVQNEGKLISSSAALTRSCLVHKLNKS